MPRPSSPVCAKASTNCPYLTLESPHHQRHHWVPPKRSPTRQSSVRWPLSGADDYNLSQIIYMMMSIFGPVNRSFRPRHAEALSELPKQSSMSKIKHLTASILRTHSQCQIRRAYPSITALSCGEPFLFITWICGWRRLTREPVSRSKAAPCGALCSAGRACRSARQLSLPRLFVCALVEPIGIEPMT